MINLSGKSLVKKPLDFKDGRIAQATVFPMFLSDGTVDFLVVVDHQEGVVYRISWTKGLITKPWFGPLRVNCTRGRLQEVSVDEAYGLTKYWHFDPWWLLKEKPFGSQPTTPALKATNTAGPAPGITSLWYSRDLSRVAMVVYTLDGSTNVVGPLRDGLLPERQPLEPPAVGRPRLAERSGEWRLRPFWETKIGV